MSTILSLRVASFLFISCFFLFSFSSSFFFSSLLWFFLVFFSRLYSAVLEQSTEACYSLSSGYCVLPPTSPLLFLPLHVWIRPPTHPPPSPGKVFRNHQRSSSKGFDMCLDWNCLVKRLETGLIIHYSEKKKVLDSKYNQYSFVIPQKAILVFMCHEHGRGPLPWSELRTLKQRTMVCVRTLLCSCS